MIKNTSIKYLKIITLLFVTTSIFLFFQNCSTQFETINKPIEYLNNNSSDASDFSKQSLIIENPPQGIHSDINFEIIFKHPNPKDESRVIYYCKIDDGSFDQCISPLILENLDQGEHLIEIKAIYDDKEESLTSKFHWKVDTQSPEIIINQAPPILTGSRDATVVFTATDEVALVDYHECSEDGETWTKCSSPIVYSGLVDGQYSLFIKAVDKVGNKSQPVMVNWSVDGLTPWFELTSKPDVISTTTTASFQYRLNEVGSETAFVECKLSNELLFKNCSNPHVFSNLQDGVYTFVIKAKTSSGFVSPEVSYIFQVDSNPPVVNIVSPLPGDKFTNEMSLITNITDGLGSGIESISCKINSGEYFLCSEMWVFKDLLTGEYNLRVKAKDKAGHFSNEESVFIEMTNIETDPAFININLSGGAALMANVIPLSKEGQLLNSYSKLGMGSKSNVLVKSENFLGAKWYTPGGILNGLKGSLSLNAKSKTRVFSIAVPLSDDTSNNPLDISGLIYDSGLMGTYSRAASNLTGDRTTRNASASINYTPKSRLIQTRVGFSYEPYIKNFDPIEDITFSKLFGIDSSSINNSYSENDVIGSLVYNSINGNVGPVGITLGGYDYHGITRAQADDKDKKVGLLIGKILTEAELKGKPILIYISTDGSVGSADSPTGGGMWVSDRGAGSQLLVFVMHPQKGFEDPKSDSEYMIGYFNEGQSADTSYWGNNSNDMRIMAANVVLFNYLALADKTEKIETLSQGLIKKEDSSKYIRFKVNTTK
jgi:hypothetical protein